MPRYYEKDMPENDEIVVVRVKEVGQTAAYCELLAYDNCEAMLPTSEINVKRFQTVKDYIHEGMTTVAQVIRRHGKNIDLSMKQVRETESEEALQIFKRGQKVETIVRTATGNDPQQTADLYRDFVWTHDDAYGFFEEVRANGCDALPANLLRAIMLKVPEPIFTEEKEIMLRFSSPDGIQRLTAELNRIASMPGIRVIVTAPPRYKIVATAKTAIKAKELLDPIVSCIC